MQAKGNHAQEVEEKLLTPFEQIVQYQYRKDEEHNDTLENGHLALESIKRKLKKMNVESSSSESSDE